MSPIIPIAADHAGFALKEQLKAHFEQKGWSFKDFGTHSTDSMDYPDVAHPLASSIETGEFPKGILICGSAQGVAMSANHHAGVRAAICWLPRSLRFLVNIMMRISSACLLVLSHSNKLLKWLKHSSIQHLKADVIRIVSIK